MSQEQTQVERGHHARVIPQMACDSHLHIFDRRFLISGDAKEFLDGVTVADYKKVQTEMGTSRAVIVTPRPYGVDNGVTVDAIAQLGIDNARGIAVLRPDVSDTELASLDTAGIRGIRFTLYNLANSPTRFDMIEPLARRVCDLNWHVQLHWSAEQIVEHAAMLARLPCKIVFDHLGRLPPPLGASHPAFDVIRRLAENGRVWVKLSAPYLNSTLGNAAHYAAAEAPTRSWIAALPDRVVWGSDWPHITELEKPVAQRPNTVELLRLLDNWTDDTRVSDRILVDNPANLYGFARPTTQNK